MMIYAADHDIRLPIKSNWVDSTSRYVKNPDCYDCPLGKTATPTFHYGYAFHEFLSAAAYPSDPKVLFFESKKTHRNAFGTLRDLPRPPRHGSVNLYVYTDGRIKYIR